MLDKFLSIQAQDFIEEIEILRQIGYTGVFLSIQAQDFIEDQIRSTFLSRLSNS